MYKRVITCWSYIGFRTWIIQGGKAKGKLNKPC